MKQLRTIFSHPFFQGSFIFTVLSFIASILSYVFNLVVARMVSIEQYGEYSSTLSYLMLFSVPFGALSLILVHRIGLVKKEEQKSYIASIEQALFRYFQAKKLLLLVSWIAIGFFLAAVSNLQIESIFFILIVSAVLFFMTLYTAFFQAEKEFLFAGLFLCLLSFAKVLGGGIGIAVHSELWFLYLVIIFAHIITILVGKWHLNKQGAVKNVKVNLPKLRSVMFRPTFYLPVVTFLGLTAISNIDIMVVKRFFSPDDVGLYAALSLLGRIILYVSLPLTAVSFSFFTGSESKQNGKLVLWMSIAMLVGLGVISVAGYAFLPNLVIKIIFSENYLSISPLVWLAAVFGSVYSLATLLGQYWIAQRHAISMLAFVCAIFQAILLLLFHSSFFTVLVLSIGCSTILSGLYIIALFFVKERSYEATT